MVIWWWFEHLLADELLLLHCVLDKVLYCRNEIKGLSLDALDVVRCVVEVLLRLGLLLRV